MTLLELIRGALEQLDRGTDAQTIEAWRDKLTRYFNDAVEDLTSVAPPRNAEEIALLNGRFQTGELKKTCVKLLAVIAKGQRWPFYYGAGANEVCVPNLTEGFVTAVYRSAPGVLEIDTDVPDIPAPYHSALILYAVGRERSMGDEASLSAARACFELYAAKKRMLMQNYGPLFGDRLENCF